MTVLFIGGALVAGSVFGFWLRKQLLWRKCPRCNGKGYLVMKDKSIQTCSNCLGTGRIPRGK